MKYIITEDQLDRIKDDILTIPYSAFNNNWDVLQKFLNKRGNPPYIINGDVKLNSREDIESLGSLIEVKGSLCLIKSSVESLGNLTSVGGDLDLAITSIESLGNLTYVGGRLNLFGTSIQSLGNLTYVGGTLNLESTPISKKYTEQQIRDMVEVGMMIWMEDN
jgi:hypothetical protein